MNKDRPLGRFIGNPVDLKWKGSLPLLSVIEFEHTLRVIDLPGVPCFLGCMVSHVETRNTGESGFALIGPSYKWPVDAISIDISAFYPPPFNVNSTISPDYPIPNNWRNSTCFIRSVRPRVPIVNGKTREGFTSEDSMVIVFGYVLPIAMCVLAAFASWCKCVDESPGLSLARRVRISGWALLILMGLATVGNVFVQSRIQEQQEALQRKQADLLRQITSTTDRALRMGEKHAAEIVRAGETLESHSNRLERQGTVAEETLAQLGSVTDAMHVQSRILVGSALAKQRMELSEVLERRANVLEEMAYNRIDKMLEEIVQGVGKVERNSSIRSSMQQIVPHIQAAIELEARLSTWKELESAELNIQMLMGLRDQINKNIVLATNKNADEASLPEICRAIRIDLASFRQLCQSNNLAARYSVIEKGIAAAELQLLRRPSADSK